MLLECEAKVLLAWSTPQHEMLLESEPKLLVAAARLADAR